MSDWHQTRMAIYDRQSQIAELYAEEVHGHGLFKPLLLYDAACLERRGLQLIKLIPGRDGWSSDRYNKPL